MASSGTLLSDLEGKGSGGDEDLVKRIFADMNMGSQQNPASQGSMIMSPNPNSTTSMSMDSAPATSHVIGKDHPTPADFAAAMHSVPRSQDAQMGPPPPSPQGNWGAPYTQPQQQYVEAPKKNIYAQLASELKIPIFVTMLVFLFSLPFINVLFSHYIPSLVKSTGDLTTVGLLVKSVVAGLSFWLIQRVVAPLVSL